MTAPLPTGFLEYLDPTSEKRDAMLYVPAVGTLAGKKLAFVDNGWSSFAKIGAVLERELRAAHGLAAMIVYPTLTSAAIPTELLDRIAAECDAAVVGMAN